MRQCDDVTLTLAKESQNKCNKGWGKEPFQVPTLLSFFSMIIYTHAYNFGPHGTGCKGKEHKSLKRSDLNLTPDMIDFALREVVTPSSRNKNIINAKADQILYKNAVKLPS